MEPRISIVTLGVADLNRALRFYRDGLGWPVSSASGDIAFLRTGGVVLALYPRALLAADAHLGAEGNGSGFGGITIAHNVREKDDVDRVLAEAVAAGATRLKAAEEAEWGGYSGYFADPDGYPWEVAWNPFFPLNLDGTLNLPAAQQEEPDAPDDLAPRQELMARVEAAQRGLDAAIVGLDDAALAEPGVVGAWSIKDVLGHVTAWEQVVVQPLEQRQRGEAPTIAGLGSTDEYNAHEAGVRQDWTLQQVRDEAASVHGRLQALLAAITDEEWAAPLTIGERERPLGAWIGGALGGDEGPGTHAAEHAVQIRAWRAARESSATS